MTRNECLERIKTDKEFKSYYWTNYNNAKKFFKPLIDEMKQERPGIDIHLHHIEVNDKNYEDWDTVVPLYNDEHISIHYFLNDIQKKLGSRKGRKVWNKGLKNCYSEETLIKMSESRKGIPNPEHSKRMKGKKLWPNGRHFSDEVRKNMSEAHKGFKLSDEAKRKIGESHKGNTYNLGRKQSPEEIENRRLKLLGNKSIRGQHWFNNGIINKIDYECPEGFISGRLNFNPHIKKEAA